jgi:hypothetical protein
MAPGASGSEQPQFVISNFADDAELSFNGGLSDGGCSDVADPTLSDHYDRQLSYYADSSSSMLGLYTTESEFPPPLDPSLNLASYNNNNGDSFMTMAPTSYNQDLSP